MKVIEARDPSEISHLGDSVHLVKNIMRSSKIAIVPAVNVLLVIPIKSFLFRPMEDDKWLKYTESMAVLPVLSGADIRYAMNMVHTWVGVVPSFLTGSLLGSIVGYITPKTAVSTM